MPRAAYPAGLQPRPPRRTVTVTQQHIDTAIKNNSKHCAGARGIADDVPGASHIEIDTATVRFTVGEKRFYYHTPASLQRFILTWDEGGTVEPFTFTLRRGTVENVARRPGVGGRPRGSKTVNRGAAVVSHPGRRTYGVRSMTPAAVAAAANRAMNHA